MFDFNDMRDVGGFHNYSSPHISGSFFHLESVKQIVLLESSIELIFTSFIECALVSVEQWFSTWGVCFLGGPI